MNKLRKKTGLLSNEFIPFDKFEEAQGFSLQNINTTCNLYKL